MHVRVLYMCTYASGDKPGVLRHESRTWWGKTLSDHSDVFPLGASVTGLHGPVINTRLLDVIFRK